MVEVNGSQDKKIQRMDSSQCGNCKQKLPEERLGRFGSRQECEKDTWKGIEICKEGLLESQFTTTEAFWKG